MPINPSTWEAELGEQRVSGQSRLHTESKTSLARAYLTKKKTKNHKRLDLKPGLIPIKELVENIKNSGSHITTFLSSQLKYYGTLTSIFLHLCSNIRRLQYYNTPDLN